ncbi:hypothetical protein JTE90_000090 [Oedothorax gibbosus]|uniref:Uncharacterized protein n=1 Tax=Oedothorax gibbosus TaxID=931172 RepID=A0AAV6UDI0_9ARAC|nr:hypothetical protein JTE90_000090 [Oedothorax gibbosus]
MLPNLTIYRRDRHYRYAQDGYNSTLLDDHEPSGDEWDRCGTPRHKLRVPKRLRYQDMLQVCCKLLLDCFCVWK